MTKPNNNSVLVILGIGLTLSALVANHAVARIDTGVLTAVQVDRFPRTLGDWRMVSEQPMSPEVKKATPTATLTDRFYVDPVKRREANVVLLTATDYADFHDPNICMPGNGYQILRSSDTTLAGQRGKLMVTEQEGHRWTVFYWWIGAASLDTGFGREQWGRVLALRDRFQGGQQRALFVRLTTNGDGETATAALTDLLTVANPEIARLTTNEGGTTVASQSPEEKTGTL